MENAAQQNGEKEFCKSNEFKYTHKHSQNLMKFKTSFECSTDRIIAAISKFYSFHISFLFYSILCFRFFPFSSNLLFKHFKWLNFTLPKQQIKNQKSTKCQKDFISIYKTIVFQEILKQKLKVNGHFFFFFFVQCTI